MRNIKHCCIIYSPEGLLGLIFVGYVPLASQSPYPISENVDPILVTLLKIRPHYRQSSRENATQSRGTSPLACYKEVPPGDFLLSTPLFTLLELPSPALSSIASHPRPSLVPPPPHYSPWLSLLVIQASSVSLQILAGYRVEWKVLYSETLSISGLVDPNLITLTRRPAPF